MIEKPRWYTGDGIQGVDIPSTLNTVNLFRSHTPNFRSSAKQLQKYIADIVLGVQTEETAYDIGGGDVRCEGSCMSSPVVTRSLIR